MSFTAGILRRQLADVKPQSENVADDQEVPVSSWVSGPRRPRLRARLGAVVAPTVVGRALRSLREAARLDQGELARLAQVATRTVGRIETGEGPPNFETVDAILTALGLTLHDLADALDEVAGRGRPARAGKLDARLVAQLVARGGLSGEYLEGYAANAANNAAPGAAADFVATVQAAAAALAQQALERARAGAALSGGGEDSGGQKG